MPQTLSFFIQRGLPLYNRLDGQRLSLRSGAASATHPLGEQIMEPVMDRRYDARTPFLISLLLICLLSSYVVSYVGLVKPEPIPQMSGFGPWPRYPVYRFGGSYSERIFSPVNWIDKRLFPRRWLFTDEDRREFFDSTPNSQQPMLPTSHHGGQI